MKDLRSIYIKIEKPNLRQKVIIMISNFHLWLVIKLFKDDEQKMKTEMKDIIINAYKAL